MWIVRWVFIAIFFAFIMIFISSNSGSQMMVPDTSYVNGNEVIVGLKGITIDYVIGKTDAISPLVLVTLSALFGFFACMILAIINYIKMNLKISEKEKIIQNLKTELNHQRNQSLESFGGEDTIITERSSGLKETIKEENEKSGEDSSEK